MRVGPPRLLLSLHFVNHFFKYLNNCLVKSGPDQPITSRSSEFLQSFKNNSSHWSEVCFPLFNHLQPSGNPAILKFLCSLFCHGSVRAVDNSGDAANPKISALFNRLWPRLLSFIIYRSKWTRSALLWSHHTMWTVSSENTVPEYDHVQQLQRVAQTVRRLTQCKELTSH